MPGPVHAGRFTARVEGDFVVFLIGMRINELRKVGQWWPTFVAMPRMLRELSADPSSGLLAYRLVLASPISPMVVQYWRDFESLEAFARDAARSHLPAWKAFRAATGDSGDVGIWHETYRVRAGEYESIYGNVPRMGLAAAGEHAALGSSSRARERIG